MSAQPRTNDQVMADVGTADDVRAGDVTPCPVSWLVVGELDDIPRQGARTLDHAGTRLAVFRTADDRVFALEDRCPHRGGPLSQGIVHGDCVTCPLHNQVVSLATGEAGDEGAAATHPVRLDGRRVLLGVAEAEPAYAAGVAGGADGADTSSDGPSPAAARGSPVARDPLAPPA